MGSRKIAVLIDSENTPHSKLSSIIEELSRYGQIIVKRAYGDFSTEQLKNWKQPLNELAIQAKQQFAYTTGKNSTDALMIIDAMDLLYSQRFDAFALISSDSDFTSLATRLRESEIFVIGVGKAMTPASFKNACDDFVAIENLNGDKPQEESPQPPQQSTQINGVEKEIWQLMHRAWQNYRDESGWAKLGEVGQYLKRLKPDFDPRNYGLKKLSDFFDKFPNRYSTRQSKQSGLEFRLVTKGSKQ
ncbi:NYN domain-containing protein [Vibrio parahaemolyticus]|uniref:NYN domain-containing protein n=1 Tax=Vibrio parahaemolyticus TaxID=670 RepID=UPI0010CF2EDA|nr:NYN domain-containing protein [Vibrio parahaemolyticus]MBE3874032.1 NYN domain-containing protein [Vibrio parahaemolyticus]MBE4479426.1 NYN domain-containing protein [Vibrio parahaemolyticus]MCS0091608.1 NYN domain-containing protein [Vibrio parahaemolyticus]MCX4117503.1 NYN domain-containing protein [Vibrio parahaemolyticus]TBT44852.1 NYN domain-containing protein [Vibrio parahaemolyticus]